MTLPSSGNSISMSQINTELGRSSTSTISLDTAENGGYATINTASPSYPNGSNPASMSEWFSYNHTAAASTPTGGWNPNDNGGVTLSNSNLTASKSTSGWLSVRGVNFYSSGIFSYEAAPNSVNSLIGFAASNASLTTYVGQTLNSITYWGNLSGRIYRNSGSDVARNFGGYNNGDIIRCEINFSTDIVSFFKNGTLMWSGSSGRDGRPVAAAVAVSNGGSVTLLS